jgi:hypothetical protein
MSRFCSRNSDLFDEDVAITMVDQLWLWILPGYGEQPDTVLTAFPGNLNPDLEVQKKSYNREKNQCVKISGGI